MLGSPVTRSPTRSRKPKLRPPRQCPRIHAPASPAVCKGIRRGTGGGRCRRRRTPRSAPEARPARLGFVDLAKRDRADSLQANRFHGYRTPAHDPETGIDLRKRSCARPKCYSVLCASRRTRGSAASIEGRRLRQVGCRRRRLGRRRVTEARRLRQVGGRSCRRRAAIGGRAAIRRRRAERRQARHFRHLDCRSCPDRPPRPCSA